MKNKTIKPLWQGILSSMDGTKSYCALELKCTIPTLLAMLSAGLVTETTKEPVIYSPRTRRMFSKIRGVV